MAWIFYFVGLVVVVAVLALIFGKAFGRGEIMPPLADNATVIEVNQEAISRQDFGAVRFDTVPRGYRPDQVDAAIVYLTEELAAVYKENRMLSAELKQANSTI